MDHYLSSTNPDMSVPSVNQESSSSQADVIEPSEDCLLQTESAIPMAQLPDTAGVSVPQLQHPINNTDNTQITTMLEDDIGTEKNTVRSHTLEQLSSNICSEERSAPYEIAGPSTFEPTIVHSVSHHSLPTTETHVIYTRIPVAVGTSKRKQYGIGQVGVACNRHLESVNEEYLEETARTKRQRTDVKETCDRSEDESSITESTIVYQGERVCRKSPNNSKVQTFDESHSGDAVIQKAGKCEHRSSEMSENSIIASLQSETITVTGNIKTHGVLEMTRSPEVDPTSMFHSDFIFDRDDTLRYNQVTEKGPSVSISMSNTRSANYYQITNKTHNNENPVDKEFDTLVKYMDPIPVIDLLATDEDFNCASLIQDTKNSDNTIQINKTLLNFVRKRGQVAYSRLKQYLLQSNQRFLATLLEMADGNKDTSALKWMIENIHEKNTSEDSLIEGFKEDLITYYRDNESNMSLSPLVDEHDVPLMDFYVRPSMKHLEKPHVLSKSTDQKKHKKKNKSYLYKQNDDVDGKMNISSYKELFFQEDSSPFTKIYLTAPAGMGKSSLSQHITMCWCQSHKPAEQSAEKYGTDDLKAMKEFDVIFLLHLRDYERSSQCNLDDLVVDMCSNLSRRSRYSRESVETVLHERRCLIILDGLDEWTHPSSCRRKPCVPHNNHPKNCTVLTTSRPWKLGTIGLSSAHIDRHVEISELDMTTSHELESNAITILNERGPRTTRLSLNDFHEAISSIKHDEICNITYIKLQLITLWYDGIPISKSRCEIYSNIVELTLTRGLQKSDLPLIQNSQPNIDTVLPKCMKYNELCKQYINLISKIGQMAFFSLFNEEKESRLIFHQDMVLQYLTESEIEFCLKTGLLSQTKDLSLITKICHKMFFQHKSIQEFFTALYISEKWENDVTRATCLKICQSLSEILEMSNVFIFLCGMNPRVYSSLWYEFQTVVEQDPIICSYRSILDSDKQWNNINSIMRSYQKMQVACLKENLNNENDEVTQISIHDIVLGVAEKYEPFLQTIITSNPQNIKSLTINNAYDRICTVDFSYASESILNLTFSWRGFFFPMTSRLKDSTVFCIPTKLLTTICFEDITLAGNKECSLYNSIAHMIMLKTIRITNIDSGRKTRQITNFCIMLDLSKISQLNQLHLAKIFLNKLVLSQHCQLRQLHLASIPLGQLDHFQTDHLQLLYMEDLNLSLVDLSLASGLQQLHIEDLPLCELRVNAESLENFIILRPTNSLPHSIFEQITESIQNAKLIQNVTLEDIKCSDHNEECIGISLIVCQDKPVQNLILYSINLAELDISQTIQLQKLVLIGINLRELDISQNTQLEELTLKEVPLKELDISQNNQLQNLTLENVPLNELDISQNIQLQKLTLKSVPLKKLGISQNNPLQNLTLESIPISVLDISQNSQLQELRLSKIPWQKLNLNTDSLKVCSVTSYFSSCALTHNNLNELVNSVQKGKSLVKLSLENIVCSDHTDMCSGVPLVLSQHSHLEKLYLSKIPVKELHLIPNCKLHYLQLKQILVLQLDLTTNMLDTLCLKDLSLIGLNLSQSTRRPNILLENVKMPALAYKELLLFTGNNTQSCDIEITHENMTGSALRQVMLSTKNLPQPVSVKLNNITISDSEWKEVFCTIRSLSLPVNLKLTDITMSDSAWKDVFSVICGFAKSISLKLKFP